MPCNCGGSKSTKQVFVYTDDHGRQTPYPSRTQAEAAKIRNHGRGSVKLETR